MEQTATKVDRHGRVVIPVEYRRALGLKEGDPVVLQLGDGVVRLLSRAEAIRQAQDLVTRHTGGKRSLVEELIAERRVEAARE